RKKLPATTTLDLTTDVTGLPLKPGMFARGFEYSDCWVDDARLVTLNARDAADRGATIRTRTRAVSAERLADGWRLTVENTCTGAREEARGRVLVNAAGPWVAKVLSGTLRGNAKASVRLVQGSHIVVRQLFEHDRAYIFQNADGRIIFAIPYEGAFTLIGTTDRDYDGDPAKVAITPEETTYLCEAASIYFKREVTPADIVWTYSGVRPLYDDGASAAQEATRDYVLDLDVKPGLPALLSIFGGKITTYRRLADAALEALSPHLPAAGGEARHWTGKTPLPGGAFPTDGRAALAAELRRIFPFLAAGEAERLARSYGLEAHRFLGEAKTREDLGRWFGTLSEAELRHLMTREWAMTAEDVLWRRSKLGLHLSSEHQAALTTFMDELAGQ
ncbi:MAG: glycerol-3-phosphate dehydrogenase, partial [Beijerinckiaceae bacterium]